MLQVISLINDKRVQSEKSSKTMQSIQHSVSFVFQTSSFFKIAYITSNLNSNFLFNNLLINLILQFII